MIRPTKLALSPRTEMVMMEMVMMVMMAMMAMMAMIVNYGGDGVDGDDTKTKGRNIDPKVVILIMWERKLIEGAARDDRRLTICLQSLSSPNVMSS